MGLALRIPELRRMVFIGYKAVERHQICCGTGGLGSWALAGNAFFGNFASLDAWLKKMDARIVLRIPIEIQVRIGLKEWDLIKLG